MSGAWNGIVVEALDRDNYSDWSLQVKMYLVGEGLWDVIEDDDDKEKADGGLKTVEGDGSQKKVEGDGAQKKVEGDDAQKKNGKALHAIQLACGKEALSLIRNTEQAKEAWNLLKASYSEDVKAQSSYHFQAQSDEPLQTGHYDVNYDVQRAVLIKGFTDQVKLMIDRSLDEVIFQRSFDGKSLLHAVVARGLTDDVTELVQLGGRKLVYMQDDKGYTALALAAELTDDTEMAEEMIRKGGKELLTMKTKDKGEIPVLLAAAMGRPRMTKFLFSLTPTSAFKDKDNAHFLDLLLSRCITAEIFDVAAAITEHPADANDILSLTRSGEKEEKEKKPRPIYALAHMPSAFQSGSHLNWWQRFVYKILIIENEDIQLSDEVRIQIVSHVASTDRPNTMSNTSVGGFVLQFYQFLQNSVFLNIPGNWKIYRMKRKHQLVLKILNYFCAKVSRIRSSSELLQLSVDDAMLQAAKYGIHEFIESMAAANPELLFVKDRNDRDIFSYAILNRHPEVFNLIRKLKNRAVIVTSNKDAFENNMLHLAATLGPSSYLVRIPNAALKMQKELQWFEGIKNNLSHSFHEAKNKNGDIPRDLFSKNHEQLVKEAQQWAKDTSSSFTLIGTLIITIMFAVAFSVPGGVNGDEGTPVFLGKGVFNIFIVADAISLITSSSSVLMFIDILTSRNAEEDFLRSLPYKLIFGLLTLFLSVASMMVAFCVALAMMLKGYRKIVIAAMGLALLPILVFVPTLLRLLAKFFISTIIPVVKPLKSRRTYYKNKIVNLWRGD